MKTGVEAVAADGRFGMPEQHMEALLRAAREQNVVIGIRPVSRFARQYLEAGNPTKPFAVKNKSSKVGIAAGLIVMNPEYSQVHSQDYAKHWEQLKSAFAKDQDLMPINLTMTLAQIELVKMQLGDKLHLQLSENREECTICWEKEGKEIRVTAKQIAGSGEYVLENDHGVPLRVLGKRVIDGTGAEQVKPVTADYDLLVVCPSYADFDPGKSDRTPLRTQGSPSIVSRELKRASSSDYTGPREDPKGGNWSQRTQTIITAINDAIAKIDQHRRGVNVETVHHNNEFHNPFADSLENNMPCLLVFPNAINLSTIDPAVEQAHVVLVETIGELEEVRNILLREGFYWPLHARYSRQGSFDMLERGAAVKAIQIMIDKRRSASTSQLFKHENSDQEDDSAAHPAQSSSDSVLSRYKRK